MDIDDIKGFLDEVNIEYSTGVDYVLISCVFSHFTHEKGTDRHPSMRILINEQGEAVYHCFACGSFGKLWLLLYSLGVINKNNNLKEVSDRLFKVGNGDMGSCIETAIKSYDKSRVKNKIDFKVLEKWAKDTFEEVTTLGRDYLKYRSITPEYANDNFDLLWDTEEQRLVFMLRNFKDRFKGAVGRCINDVVNKYRNYWSADVTSTLGHRKVFNYNAKRIIVVEGFIDMIKTAENICILGLSDIYEVVCTFKCHLSDRQLLELVDLYKTVYIFYDDDKAGNNGARKALSCLDDLVPFVFRVKPPENKDPGETSFSELELILDKINYNIGV